jgi:hypothetical protein
MKRAKPTPQPRRRAALRCAAHLRHCLNLAEIAAMNDPERAAGYIAGAISDLRDDLAVLRKGAR